MVSAWIVSAVTASLLVLVASDPCVTPGDNLNGSTGFFSSPNFPNNFSTNSHCNWTITVPVEQIIKVTFYSFVLNPNHNSNCQGPGSGVPHVVITNVASGDNDKEFKICGNRLPDPVYSVGNSMQVRLITGADVYQGFNASYEAIDGKLLCPEDVTLNETSGVITSPYYPRKYPDNQTCTWQITAPQGIHVKLEFSKINMQTCNAQGTLCTCDYLQIHNGVSEDLNENQRICGSPGQKLFYSILGSLKVQFVSDDTMRMLYEGFKATYTLIRYTPPICPIEAIPLTGEGKLSSPNYPTSNYPASRKCSWMITVPAGKLVKLVFKELALGSCQLGCSSGKCTYVELYDGPSANSSSLGRFCGGSTPKEVFSNGNQMFVNFRSSSSLDWGFEAQYEPMQLQPTDHTPPCNQTVGPWVYGLVDITYDKAELRLIGKECLSNGNQTRYIKIIVIPLGDEDQDIGSSTDTRYADDKDYRIEKFDYDKRETFTIDKLKSNSYYAAFQRSFDDSGFYESEKFLKFKTAEKPEKPEKPIISAALFSVVVVVVALVCAISGAVVGFCYAKRKWKLAPVDSAREIQDISPEKIPAIKSDTAF